MSGNTFIGSRLEIIENRFSEIDTLLQLAKKNISNNSLYSSLCRSAHVLLVSHVEGIYKDVVRDIIDDLNRNTNYIDIKKVIFKTHANHFIHHKDVDKTSELIKEKLWNVFKKHKTELILEPFLRIDNKNPTPQILEEILKKFGEERFFNSLINTRLEIVFENDARASLKELQRIKRYLENGVKEFPYTVDKSYFYNFSHQSLAKGKKGLFEEFLNDFLYDRHKIIHGQTLNHPKNDKEIADSKIKIEVLIFAFIINLCHSSNPILL